LLNYTTSQKHRDALTQRPKKHIPALTSFNYQHVGRRAEHGQREPDCRLLVRPSWVGAMRSIRGEEAL